MDREKAIKLRDSVDFKINKIEQNKKKALNVAAEENKKVEEVKKEENEDSDDDGKISQSIYTSKQVAKYTHESETEVIYFNIFIIGRNQT